MNRVASWFCKIFLKPIVDRILIKEVKGWENIPRGNFILVSNHQSYLDIIIDSYLCVPGKFHFIGQIDKWKGTIMGWLVRTVYFLCGVIPLDRTSGQSKKNAIQEAIKVLKKGDILVLYPEGGRSRNGEIQEGKMGTAKIFLQTGIPVVPAGIKGTFELMPPHGKLKIKKIVEINIGRRLFLKEEFAISQNLNENSDEYQELLQKITNKIMEEISNLI